MHICACFVERARVSNSLFPGMVRAVKSLDFFCCFPWMASSFLFDAAAAA